MFIQTRGYDEKSGKNEKATFSEVVLDPSASFGGLYVPEKLPKITKDDIKKYTQMSYQELALDVLKKFKIDIKDDVLKQALKQYDDFDDPNNPAPIVKLKDKLFVCELYHGHTRAFKDMALQPFGFILSHLAKEQKQKYLILVATSGDTGPATLEAFRDKEYIQVVCLYPDGKTSDIQRLQMVTETANNSKIVAVKGDFDSTQNTIKELINSSDFKSSLEDKEVKLSAANSVNFGRIIFQLIYHFYSYVQLVNKKEIELGDTIDLTIPSGNFGNALGAFYAKKMGLFVDRINIASNSNNVLTKFINDGIYDLREHELTPTISPAMDILKSSNVERVLHYSFSDKRTKELMESLDENDYFKLNKNELTKIQKDFSASFSSDSFCLEQINNHFVNYNYLFDTHTATCFKFDFDNKTKVQVFYSTAEWTKFAPSIYKAINYISIDSDVEALDKVSEQYGQKITHRITNILEKLVMHRSVLHTKEIKRYILDFLSNK